EESLSQCDSKESAEAWDQTAFQILGSSGNGQQGFASIVGADYFVPASPSASLEWLESVKWMEPVFGSRRTDLIAGLGNFDIKRRMLIDAILRRIVAVSASRKPEGSVVFMIKDGVLRIAELDTDHVYAESLSASLRSEIDA